MAPFVENLTNIFSFLALTAGILAAIFLFILATPLRRLTWSERLTSFVNDRAILLGFLVSLAAALGSLFYSDVAGFTPCLLCWWQRIFLYPQVILLFVALIRKDKSMRLYSIVLSSIGTLIAIYHTYIQFGGTDIVPCSATGPSCTTLYFLQYGYITIPTMSLTAFVILLLIMLSPRRKGAEN